MTLPIFLSPQALSQSREENLTRENIRYARMMSSDGLDQQYADLSDAALFIHSELNLASLEAQKKSFSYALEQERFRTEQITNAHNMAAELSLLLNRVRNSNAVPDSNFQEKITGFLSTLTSICNQQFNGNTTLAGTGQTAVTDLSVLGGLNSGSPPDYSYYLGGDNTAVMSMNETLQLPMYPVTAENPAFEKLIRACRICKTGNVLSPSDPAFTSALALVEQIRTQDFPEAMVKSARNTQRIQEAIDAIPFAEIQNTTVQKTYGLEGTAQFLEAYEGNRVAMEISRSITLQMLNDLRRFSERL